MPEMLTVLVAVVAAGTVAAVGAALVVRSSQRHAAGQRDAAVQAAVETVLQVAGEKFSDQRAAAERELELRNRAISDQMAGFNHSFEQQVGGLNHSFEHQLAGMNSELRRVNELVNDMQRDRAAQHGQVVESIRQAAKQTASLSEATQGLREALANSRARSMG